MFVDRERRGAAAAVRGDLRRVQRVGVQRHIGETQVLEVGQRIDALRPRHRELAAAEDLHAVLAEALVEDRGVVAAAVETIIAVSTAHRVVETGADVVVVARRAFDMHRGRARIEDLAVDAEAGGIAEGCAAVRPGEREAPVR